jgi:hypothetical protein
MSSKRVKTIMQEIKKFEEKQDKIDKLQKDLEEYMIKSFKECMDQSCIDVDTRQRMKIFLKNIQEPIFSKSLVNLQNIEPFDITKEGSDGFVDIFDISSEEFDEILDKY